MLIFNIIFICHFFQIKSFFAIFVVSDIIIIDPFIDHAIFFSIVSICFTFL